MRRVVVVASLLALLSAALVAGSLAKTAGTPFYLVPPTPRKECHNVKHCVSVIGPWVAVPARGQATFLLTCPKRRGYVGGTDTRASSTNVQVWFDGQIGSPVRQSVTTGPFLLFHGVTTDGRPGTFQPTIGCIKLLHQTKGRSTVSARQSALLPGTTSGTPLELRSKLLVLVPGLLQKKTVRCLRGERLVGSWQALAFIAEDPPRLNHVHEIESRTVSSGRKVTIVVNTHPSLPFVPLAEVQVGAMCAT